ncbi:hypothetical protein ACFL0Y_04830 [Patescibacteria group bacterium]
MPKPNEFEQAIVRLGQVPAPKPGEGNQPLGQGREAALNDRLDRAWRAGQRASGIVPREAK